jgi:hypothetical protein
VPVPVPLSFGPCRSRWVRWWERVPAPGGLAAGANENALRNGSRVVAVTVPATMDSGARTVVVGIVVVDVVADVVAVVVVEGAATIVPAGAFGAAVTVGAGVTPTLGTGVTPTLEAGATVAETEATTVGPRAADTGAAAAGNGESVSAEGTGAVDCGEAVATDGVVTSGPDEARRGGRLRSPLWRDAPLCRDAPLWRDAPCLSEARAARRLASPCFEATASSGLSGVAPTPGGRTMNSLPPLAIS